MFDFRNYSIYLQNSILSYGALNQLPPAKVGGLKFGYAALAKPRLSTASLAKADVMALALTTT